MAGGNLSITLAGIPFVEGVEDLSSVITEGAGLLGRQWRQTVRRAWDLTVHVQRYDAGSKVKGQSIKTKTDWMKIDTLHDLEAALDAAAAAALPVRLILDDGNRVLDLAVHVVDITHGPPLEDTVADVEIEYAVVGVWE